MREEAERDRLDSNRAVAPLRPAPDAIIIINDALTPEEVAARALHEVERAARVAVGGEAG